MLTRMEEERISSQKLKCIIHCILHIRREWNINVNLRLQGVNSKLHAIKREVTFALQKILEKK